MLVWPSLQPSILDEPRMSPAAVSGVYELRGTKTPHHHPTRHTALAAAALCCARAQRNNPKQGKAAMFGS